MTVVQAWDCSVNFDASVNKELLGVGDGVKTIFWTKLFPIVDGVTRQATEASANVLIYYNGSATPIPSVPYEVSGNIGAIMFDDPISDGSNVTISYNYTEEVGYCQAIGLHMEANVDAQHAIGARAPVSVEGGDKRFGGEYKSLWVNVANLGKVLVPDQTANETSGNFSSNLADLNLDMTIAVRGALDVQNPGHHFYVQDVIFNDYQLDVPTNAYVSEGGTFSFKPFNYGSNSIKVITFVP